MTSLRFHHTGIVVSGVERSIAFYREHFGAQVEHRVDGAGGVPEVARLHGMEVADFDLVYLRIGDGLVELLRYRQPPGSTTPGVGSDLGATHIAFQTDDISSAYARLTAAGVRFHSPPLRVPDGLQLAFFLDPDGNEIELMQPPVRSAAP